MDFAIVSVGVRPDGQQVLVGIGDVTGGTHFNPGHLVYDEVLLADPLDCLFGGVEEQFGVNIGMLIA